MYDLFKQYLDLAFAEDLMPCGDITSELFFDHSHCGSYHIRARQAGIMSGSIWITKILHYIDPEIGLQCHISDGIPFKEGDILCTISGLIRYILMAERILLNLLQRSISISTYTSQFVQQISDLDTKITDTRKTMPALRALDRQAVLCGGGHNHRYNLSTGILIKDNHIAHIPLDKLKDTLIMIYPKLPHLTKVMIEVDSLEQYMKIRDLEFIDMILLDNFTPAQVQKAMTLKLNQNQKLEASGGINLDNIREYALTGIDYISIGSLTYAMPTIDIGLDET